MPIVSGSVRFSRLYTIDTITADDFSGGTNNPNNTLTLSNLSQVDPGAIDFSAQVNDINGNGSFNAVDQLITTFPGASTTTVLMRVNLFQQFGNEANGFGSGVTYGIFADTTGQQYILFNEDFDVSRISGGSVTLTEQGDAVGNMEIYDIICFAGGTMILTPSGERPIEDLQAGDELLTFDGRRTTVRWRSTTRCSAEELALKPNLRPIRIAAGSIAPDVPNRDLYLSRQHRVLVRSPIAERLCGDREALLACNKLLSFPGVDVDAATEEVTYHHVLTDRHDILVSNGMPSESLHIGERLLDTVGAGSYREILRLVQQGRVESASVRPILSAADSKEFVRRCLKNGRAPLESPKSLQAA